MFLYELHVCDHLHGVKYRGRGIARQLLRMAGEGGLHAMSTDGQVPPRRHQCPAQRLPRQRRPPPHHQYPAQRLPRQQRPPPRQCQCPQHRPVAHASTRRTRPFHIPSAGGTQCACHQRRSARVLRGVRLSRGSGGRGCGGVPSQNPMSEHPMPTRYTPSPARAHGAATDC